MQDIVEQLSRREPVPSRPLENITGIALHHSADEGTPEGWANYHTKAPEDGGPEWGPANSIGYHAAVMRDGTTYKTAYDRDVTPGVANHNGYLLHVVCQGNLGQQPPDEGQIQALLGVVRHYMQAYNIPVERVKTHAEWQNDPAWGTSCPGVPHLGEDIRNMLSSGS